MTNPINYDSLQIRSLQRSDDRSSFDCNSPDLNAFLRQIACQKQDRYEQKTYVICEESKILAFMTLAPGESSHNSRSVPVLRLLRLGTDQSVQGKGLGKALMLYAFKLAFNMSDMLGCTGILVDAKKDSISFYTSLGFVALGNIEDDDPLPMFLKIGQIKQALEQSTPSPSKTSL